MLVYVFHYQDTRFGWYKSSLAPRWCRSLRVPQSCPALALYHPGSRQWNIACQLIPRDDMMSSVPPDVYNGIFNKFGLLRHEVQTSGFARDAGRSPSNKNSPSIDIG